MTIPLVGIPPPLPHCSLSWRQLYERGCFFQRELVDESALSTETRKRGFTLSQVGREHWEQRDNDGALRPVAFAKTAYVSGGSPALPPEDLVFRDECESFEPWDKYAWDAWGFPTVSALFTPWQLLMVADAIEGGQVSVPLEVLLREGGRDKWAESLRWFFEEKHRQWTSLQAWWDPSLRLLVRLQNRYWPLVQGSTRVLPRADGSFYDPEAVEDFDASSVVAELQVTTDDAQLLLGAYRHLARRGFDLEFGDGWYLLRQMTPRARRRRFEGQAGRAQDCYDAAEVVRRFYRDLTGEVLPDAEVVALAATDENWSCAAGNEIGSSVTSRGSGTTPRTPSGC